LLPVKNICQLSGFLINIGLFASGGACSARGNFLEKLRKIARSGINLSEPVASVVGKILNSSSWGGTQT
jgi:hypothetical protein